MQYIDRINLTKTNTVVLRTVVLPRGQYHIAAAAGVALLDFVGPHPFNAPQTVTECNE